MAWAASGRSFLGGVLSRAARAVGGDPQGDPQGRFFGSIQEAYCAEAPSAQTAVDIFEGEWASGMPPPLEDVRAGPLPLFADPKIEWGLEVIGGVEAARVLEIGPLEGSHTFLLDRIGAREVVAVESNARAFLKCLVMKNLVGIPSATFLYGDALRFVEQQLAVGAPQFDLCLASGVLYHFASPIAALELLCRSSDRLILWTHYFDSARINAERHLRTRFSEPEEAEDSGFRYTRHEHAYAELLQNLHFYGGNAPTSTWLERDAILGALGHFGFDVVAIGHEEPGHPNGPAFAVAAKRRTDAT